MWKELKFAFYTIKKNIQSSAELRTSFLMNIIGMAINNTSFIILWIFFVQSVGVIGGWTAADIVGLQGFLAISYGIVFSVGVGIRKLPEYVTSGAFDRFMLSPKSLLTRVATASFSPSGIGDIVFGATCLIIYGILIHATAFQVALMLIFVFLSVIVFGATAIAIYSLSFFFMDSTATTNGIFELFMTPTLFHGGAFQGGMRFIFTFIIPSLLIGALPVEAVRDISLLKLLLVSVLAILWLILAIKIFHKAIRRYESSNLMTFGS
ncbi:MAG: ABC-2 family transporter protein [Candidatus Moraniibacteriota bacterium]|nr:MAG: ABC-2 family transporter protein [Candidatus Moranbacteria bacterium]